MRSTIMVQLLERIISFIWESCRLILLVGSLTLAFMSILMIGSLVYFKDVFSFLNENNRWPRYYTIWLIVTAAYLLLLGIIGCIGSLYKQRRFIKLFSALSIVTVILGILFVIYYVPNVRETIQTGIEFDIAMSKYDWRHNTNATSAPVVAATPAVHDNLPPAGVDATNKQQAAPKEDAPSGSSSLSSPARLTIRLDKNGAIVFTSPFILNAPTKTALARLSADAEPQVVQPAQTNEGPPPVSIDVSQAAAPAVVDTSDGQQQQPPPQSQQQPQPQTPPPPPPQQQPSEERKSVEQQHSKENIQKNVTEFWDNLQSRLRCCGLSSKNEWRVWSPDKNSYPKSCCSQASVLVVSNGTKYDYCQESPSSYSSCYSRIELPIAFMAIIILLAVVASAFLSVLGLLSGFKSRQFN